MLNGLWICGRLMVSLLVYNVFDNNIYTVCFSSLVQFSYYTLYLKMNKTSWTYSTKIKTTKHLRKKPRVAYRVFKVRSVLKSCRIRSETFKIKKIIRKHTDQGCFSRVVSGFLISWLWTGSTALIYGGACVDRFAWGSLTMQPNYLPNRQPKYSFFINLFIGAKKSVKSWDLNQSTLFTWLRIRI